MHSSNDQFISRYLLLYRCSPLLILPLVALDLHRNELLEFLGSNRKQALRDHIEDFVVRPGRAVHAGKEYRRWYRKYIFLDIWRLVMEMVLLLPSDFRASLEHSVQCVVPCGLPLWDRKDCASRHLIVSVSIHKFYDWDRRLIISGNRFVFFFAVFAQFILLRWI